MKDNNHKKNTDALDYHEFPKPGKIAVVPTKKHASSMISPWLIPLGWQSLAWRLKKTKTMLTDIPTKETSWQ